ncbi:hypothetical protein J1N35_038729 [Gossypium stocksii]|uniref:Reverse transcriptase domain-containing protein n=1 Tax=Gossypium stocksii TaxID=47602 RepID=A0A9D3ZN63_9ROSI|nr:hypothetical protein J1N35_038729 [Gossypium stocksii]
MESLKEPKAKESSNGFKGTANKEEIFWEQWARVNWLKNRDRNTSFFHKVIVNRQNRSRMTELEGEDGQWVSKDEEMLQIALKYFENLLSGSKIGDDERLLESEEKWIIKSMNNELFKPFTEEGIGHAVKTMAPLKAPGNNGFPTIFYQRLGFHIDWVVLIMRCICSVSYTLGINGDTSDGFSPPRGLRQGDPLSLYLFLICAEGFSTLLHETKQKDLMWGAPIGRERLSINHLFFFADGCILFERLIWRFGSGEGVNIWNDPLLSGLGSSRLSVQSINPYWITVNQLIDVESNTRNNEVTCRIIDRDQAKHIFNIPLASSKSYDMLVWRHEATGEYSVKSGYRVLVTEKLQNIDYNPSIVDKYKDFYKLL